MLGPTGFEERPTSAKSRHFRPTSLSIMRAGIGGSSPTDSNWPRAASCSRHKRLQGRSVSIGSTPPTAAARAVRNSRAGKRVLRSSKPASRGSSPVAA
jgi:hypothetical protein